MSRFIVLGTVAVLSFATASSALSFTPTQDNRQTYAGTVVFGGSFTDGDTESPSSPFAPFSSDISAHSDYDDAFADAWASQFSQIGSMYIQGSGSAMAQIGVSFDNWVNDESDTTTNGSGQTNMMHSSEVSAGGQSFLEILFTIDMDAHYDLEGFIDAGIGLAQGTIPYGSIQSTSLVLFDIDNGVALVDETVTDGVRDVSTAGHISPGNYRFTVDADVSVFSIDEDVETNGITVPLGSIYSASAGFKGIGLTLSGRDQPIPEPVTTTLAGLGLGALVLQTTRRRRA